MNININLYYTAPIIYQITYVFSRKKQSDAYIQFCLLYNRCSFYRINSNCLLVTVIHFYTSQKYEKFIKKYVLNLKDSIKYNFSFILFLLVRRRCIRNVFNGKPKALLYGHEETWTKEAPESY